MIIRMMLTWLYKNENEHLDKLKKKRLLTPGDFFFYPNNIYEINLK